MQELDQRKEIILKALIRNYLETGEPVGSRTISKEEGLTWSSATIRNEMADLEEMGYIRQTHTSSGRVPTDQGYRFYVDAVLAEKDKEVEELRDIYLERADHLEGMLQQVVKVLADNTNYATLISAPSVSRNKIKFIQLSDVDTEHLLVVIVAEGNLVRNKIIPVDEPLNNETLLKLNMLLNTHLSGMPMEQINLGMIARLKEQAGIHSELVSNVLDAVAESINVEDLEIYTSGATNILNYPELTDKSAAKDLLDTFEQKEELVNLVNERLADENETGIQVYIGNEAPVRTMKDCSVITASYDLGEGMQGTIGIVGPKRMDYEKVLSTLRQLTAELDKIYKRNG